MCYQLDWPLTTPLIVEPSRDFDSIQTQAVRALLAALQIPIQFDTTDRRIIAGTILIQEIL
jgi:hypothetical protein